MARIYKTITITWIIKNYSFCDNINELRIYSPTFIVEDINKSSWQICGYIRDSLDTLVSVKLCVVRKKILQTDKNQNEKIPLELEIEFRNSENKLLYVTEEKKLLNFQEMQYCTFSKVFSNHYLEEKVDTSEDILILKYLLRINLEKEVAGIPIGLAYTFKTTICVDEVCYLRKINFSKNSQLVSPLTFAINKNKQLILSIEAPEDDILFKITQEDEETCVDGKLKCKITLLDEEGNEKNSSRNVFTFSEKSKIWHIPSFLKISLLKKIESRSLYLKFNFTFANGLQLKEQVDEWNFQHLSHNSEVSKNVPATNSLICDLRKMLFSKELSDVSFCVEREIISAHKFVLSSRSPVFSAMFQQDMVESQTGVIDIVDMDVQTLKLLMEFLYTGDFSESDCERILELLLASEKYEIPSLKKKCVELLKPLLSPDNVCDVASVADMIGHQFLKDVAMVYVKGNVAPVLNSPKWSITIEKNSQLCAEIIKILTEDLKRKQLKD